LKQLEFSALAFEAEQEIKDIARDVEIFTVKQEVGRLTPEDVERIGSVYTRAKEVRALLEEVKDSEGLSELNKLLEKLSNLRLAAGTQSPLQSVLTAVRN